MPLTQNRAATAAAFAAQGFVVLSLTTRLPRLSDNWGIDVSETALAMGVMVLLAGLGSLLAEAIARRSDSALSLRVGFALQVVAVPALVLTPSMSAALPAMALLGLGVGAVDASANMQAVALEHRYGRPILPSLHGAWTVGAILASALTLVTADVSDLALCSLMLPALLALAAPYLRGSSEIPALAAAGLPTRPIMLVGIAMMLFYAVDTAVQTWGATYAHDVFGTSQGTSAACALVYLTCSGLVRLVGDRLVTGWGIPPLVRAGAVVGVLGLAVVVVAPNFWVSLVGFALAGAGLAVVAPLAFSAAASLAGGDTSDPEVRRARVDAAIARFNLWNYAGAVLGSVVTGLASGGNLNLGFILPAVLTLALLPMARHFVPMRPRVTA